MGRLVALKAVDVLLEAGAELMRSGRLVVDVIGDGPERGNLEALAERLGVRSGVSFAGWVAHEKLQERLALAHALGFPSVREFGGGAVLEAMATGLAGIVADYGGPGELVTEETGFAVKMGTREELREGLRVVLERVCAEPGVLERKGRAARERVERLFTWGVRARQVLEVYRWVLGEREKPDFGMPLERA